jgi:hypothetical protein
MQTTAAPMLEVVFSLQFALRSTNRTSSSFQEFLGGGYRHTQRQQNDLINLPLFFKIRKVGKKKKGHSSQKVAEGSDRSSKIHM